MKKVWVVLFLVFGLTHFAAAENMTLSIGNAKSQFAAVALGGNIWDFLQLQLDVMKYLKDDTDPALQNPDPKLSRSDFLGVSVVVALKLPIHLIPGLDRFEFIQPYISAGRGYGLESLKTEYNDAPNAGADQKTGFFNKMISFNTLGGGVLFMIAPKFGVKLDYRQMSLAEQKGIPLPARKMTRISIGVAFGAYK